MILLVSQCILYYTIGMMKSQTVLEWERKARYQHGTFTVAIPKQITRKWGIGPGSVLKVALLNDGTIQVKLSDEEIAYQERTEAMA